MPASKRKRLYIWLLAAAMLLALMAASSAWAVDYTWNGASDGTTWTLPNNWSPNTSAAGVGPTVGDTVEFWANVSIALGGARTVDAITIHNGLSAQFDGGLLTTGTLTFDLAGTTVTIPNSVYTFTVTSGLNTGGNGFTFNGNGTLYVPGNGTLTSGVAVTLGSVAKLNFNGSQTISLPGGASGAGTGIYLFSGAALTIELASGNSNYQGFITGSGSLTKTGSNSLTLPGSNTYDGSTTVSAGSLIATGAGNQLPAGTDLTLGLAALCQVDDQNLASLAGTGFFQITGANTATVNQAINTTFSGNVVGLATGTLRKTGAGVLTLTGKIDTGLDAFGGVLLMNGNALGAVNADNGGELRGSGRCQELVTIANGTLAPGNSIGTFNAENGLDLQAASTLAIEASGGAADQVNVTGAVNLANGAITVSGTPTLGAVFTIINNDAADAVSGTFGGLAEGATLTSGGQQYEISYIGGDGNDVTLTALTGATPGGGGGGGGGDTEPEPEPNTLPAPSVSQGSGPSPAGSQDGSKLSWPHVKGADYYRVYRADCPTCKRKEIGRVRENSFMDNTAIPGQPYYYWLRSENADGLGPFSNWMTAWRYEQNPGRPGDFNGDGVMDLLWWNPENNQISIWFMNGGQATGVSAPMEGLDISQWLMIGTGDYNGDGACDLLWWRPETGEVQLWYMQAGQAAASSVFQAMSDPLAQTMPGHAAIAYSGDLNGDGFSDILWRDYASGEVTVWLMGADGKPQLSGPPTPASDDITKGGRPGLSGALQWQVAGLADANGDGRNDVIWQDKRNNRLVSWLMDGTGITQAIEESKGLDTVCRLVGVGDLNMDKQADIVWRNEASGEVKAWLMQAGVFSEERLIVEGSEQAAQWQVKAVGDFCTPGCDDVYCKHSESGEVRIVTLDGREFTPHEPNLNN